MGSPTSNRSQQIVSNSCLQLQFNLSTIPLIASQAPFYTQLINCLRSSRRKVLGKECITTDYAGFGFSGGQVVLSGEAGGAGHGGASGDCEDVVADVLQGMMAGQPSNLMVAGMTE